MIRISLEYLLYRIFAPHQKGFGVHSPFVFNLVAKIINQKDDGKLLRIKKWRNDLCAGKTQFIKGGDPGAGSKIYRKNKRSVRSMIRFSSVPHKYGRILYHLAMHFKPATIIELGTGVGISTAYLSEACPGSVIVSIDADESRLDFAEKALKRITENKPVFYHGRFDSLLLSKLLNANHPLMVFVDGDHKYESVLAYFYHIVKYKRADTIIVIDDIRWSEGMKKAWDAIKKDDRTILCIDLFFMGMVFFREGMVKQDYIIYL